MSLVVVVVVEEVVILQVLVDLHYLLLVAAAVAARHQGAQVSLRPLEALVVLVVAVALQTDIHLILAVVVGLGILHQLYRDKDMVERLHPDPDLIGLVVEEVVPVVPVAAAGLVDLEELLQNFHLLLLEEQYQHQFFQVGNH